MENATKALLIAAAILIAILIISLALVVYNMASQTVGNINLSKAEIQEFNGPFQQYEGNNVSGSDVNALLRTVLNHNINEQSTDRKVSVTITPKTGAAITLATTDTSLPATLANTGKKYTVRCTLNSANGLVTSVTATEK